MKVLPQENYLIRPFKTFKRHSYNLSYLVGNSDAFAVYEATLPPQAWAVTSDVGELNYDSIIYKNTLYASVINLFYSPPHTEHEYLYFSRRPGNFNRMFHPSGSGQVYVISINQQTFGEKVKEGTFVLNSTPLTSSIIDDGQGRLVLSNSTSSVVGNIFYEMGIAVVSPILAPTTGSTVTVSYNSQFTIYEHTAVCTLDRGEFNFSTNPTLDMFPSSSVSESIGLLDAMASGSLTPYVTTIGLYNNSGEMVAIAKLPRPLKRAPEIDQTFIVRFDI